MKKLTQKQLEKLAKEMPVLREQEERVFNGESGVVYSQDEFERMLMSGTWQGGYVQYGNSSKPIYMSPEATINGSLSNVFPETGDETYDLLFKGGYELGYKAAISSGSLDDILAIAWSGIMSGVAGPDAGGVDYGLIWYSNGIREGYKDGLKDR